MKISRKVISMVLVLILSLSAMITATTVQTQAAQKLKYQVGKTYKKLTDKYKGDYACNMIEFEAESAGKISFKARTQNKVPAAAINVTSEPDKWKYKEVGSGQAAGWIATCTLNVKKGDYVWFCADGIESSYKIKCKGGASLKVTSNTGWEVMDAGW